MKPYAVLLRGVNVGGKNLVPMAGLKKLLEGLGFEDVATYIASGNAVFRSPQSAAAIKARIEKALPEAFKLDSAVLKVLVLSLEQLTAVVLKKPKGFGDAPAKYHSDVVFLMGLKEAQAMAVFSPKEGVDRVWRGKGVIYSQRLSALRTKSRLKLVMGAPEYKSMTIRNWNTTVKLQEMLEALAGTKAAA
jgi:uncharacterized protein (DUF1697 family)